MVSVGCQGQAPLCLDQMMVEGRTESHSDLQHPSEQVRGVYGDSGPSGLIVNVAYDGDDAEYTEAERHQLRFYLF